MKRDAWDYRPLGQVCETTSGGTPDRGDASLFGGSIPWVKSGELQDKPIVTTSETITTKGLQQSSAKLIPPGSLLVAMYGANVGMLGLLDIEAATNQAVCAVLPSPKVVREFLFFCLLAQRERLIAAGVGGAQPNISQEKVRSIPIPLPPRDAQIAYADWLVRCFIELRSAHEGIAAQVKTARLLTQRLLAAHFGNLPAISIGGGGAVASTAWSAHRLVGMARLESGHTPSRRHPEWWGGDVPWLALPDIRKLHGKVAHQTAETTNAAGLANSSARLLPVGTVCVSRTASIGFVTMLGRPMATSQDFCNWICDPERLEPEFLMYAFMASQDHLRELGSGAVHKTIYMPTIESFHLHAPALDQQRRIARALRDQLAAAEALQSRLAERQAEIERLPQRILAAAFGDA